MTEWRTVPGWDAYEVSDEGSVRRVRAANGTFAGRILRWRPRNGYVGVVLHQNKKRLDVNVNVLVLLAFVGPRPSPRHEAAHDDGNRFKNALSNLAWKTRHENEADKRRHGTMARGESQGSSKLTEQAVREMRARYACGETIKMLAAEFDATASHIWRVVTRRAWAHLS